MQWKPAERIALVALLGGATGIGFAPIFVRLSEVGPSATAFYRLAFALPVLWLLTSLEPRRVQTESRRVREDEKHEAQRPPGTDQLRTTGSHRGSASPLWWLAAAGFFFACDLAFWHWSIKLTSVANSTLLTNFAPFFVMLGARVLFSERITPFLVFGLVLALLGSALLVGVSAQLTTRHLLGDLLALITAGFYGAYLLTVKYLRIRLSTAKILAWSGLVSCALLLLIALASRETVQVTTVRGWIVLLSLGLISHLGGQGLIAYALAHLPAGFSSVGLLLQPVVAALLAWLILHEPLGPLQGLGGGVILVGIAIASRGKPESRGA